MNGPENSDSPFSPSPFSWEAIIASYAYDAKDWRDSFKMLELVNYISQQPYAPFFQPSQSIGNLFLTPIWQLNCKGSESPLFSLRINWHESMGQYKLVFSQTQIHAKANAKYRLSEEREDRFCTEASVGDIIEQKLLRMYLYQYAK